ncbi:MAG: CocE/NonD family hydrolase [Pseudomonadota bacterium]
MYDWHLKAGPTGKFDKRWFRKSFKSWDDFVSRPTYDAWWQAKAMQRLLAEAGSKGIEVLTVHSWFDQEDTFGPPAAYRALEDSAGARTNYFVAGPWYHSQWDRPGTTYGPFSLNGDTSKYFRDEILLPFFRRTLKPKSKNTTAQREAVVYETGVHQWRTYNSWPPKKAKAANIYLHPNGKLAFSSPTSGADSKTTFISDPAKPVPFRQRPIPAPFDEGSGWDEWLGEDQRFVDGRPDVLTFVGAPLDKAVTITGPVRTVIRASTTGEDADWVVKLIDVHPPETPEYSHLGGYQFMVSGDIMRGRYRNSFSAPEPIKPGKVETFNVMLPQVNHTFKKGHRIMVQVQSSWFPLYDRNPQSYVENIHFAEPDDYSQQTHAVFHGEGVESRIEVLTLD